MYSQPRQAEIKAHRITGVDATKRRGNFPCGPRIAALPRRQSQLLRQPVHVGVQRYNQLGGLHAAPSAGIDTITPNHPTQEQVHPLQAAPAPGKRQQDCDRLLGARVKQRQKGLGGGQRGLGVRRVPGQKGSLQRAKLTQQRTDGTKEAREMIGGEKPIDKTIAALAQLTCPALAKRLGRPWSQGTKRRGAGAQNASHPAERKRRRDKRHHFPVRRVLVTEDHLQRIRVEKSRMVVAFEQVTEQPGKARRGVHRWMHRWMHGSLHGSRFPGKVSTMILQSTILIEFVSRYFYWVFLAILILNMTQRKHQKTAQKKRMATLYLAIAALVIYAGAELCRQYALGDGVMVAVILAVVAAVAVLRNHTFPFTLTCQCTGRRLDWNTILYRDDNCLPEPEFAEGGESDDEPDDAYQTDESQEHEDPEDPPL